MERLMLKYIEETPFESESYLSQELCEGSLELIQRMADKQPVVLTGCGTSYHLAMLGERYFESVGLVSAKAVPSFDLAWYRSEAVKGKIVIAISQSGASKASRDAIAAAKKQGAYVVSITAAPDTMMAKEADSHILLPGGPEKALPKTRVFTTGALLLLRLAYETRKKSDSSYKSPFPQPAALRAAMEKALSDNRAVVDEAAKAWNKYEIFTFIGSGPAWTLSCEIALKMRENNYTYSEGYESEEFGHGRTCSFYPDRPLTAFAMRGPGVARTGDILNNAIDMKLPTMAVVEEGVTGLPETDYVVRIPAMPCEFTAAIVAALPMQLFSHQFTLVRGLNPDMIRLDDPEFDVSHHKWIFPPGTH